MATEMVVGTGVEMAEMEAETAEILVTIDHHAKTSPANASTKATATKSLATLASLGGTRSLVCLRVGFHQFVFLPFNNRGKRFFDVLHAR